MELLISLILFAILVSFGLPKIKGFLGEVSVRLYLNKLDKEKYQVFNDVLVPLKNRKASQIDHVVVSPYGIFVIETKNYKGWIYGDSKSKYWTQVIYKRKEKLYNPIWQNYAHIKALQEYLGTENEELYQSIVSFSNRAILKKIEISGPNTSVVYSSRLVSTIHAHKKVLLTTGQVRQIAARLEKTLKADGEQKKQHVKNIKDSQRFYQYKINADMCPKCGADLVVRKGKYGAFMGCGNYPKCRFVVSNKQANM
ncbi:NERD domain-containing protein [Fredinandcohnia sp. QZ13]|uniref:NERD domain-containing protein n=1 Tax=Fredinandcohnia sp. QZ13 TaxID=3073144 RepID=UPI0028533576|nr:NERD domain-containing protein [Fredinandcohnia sp. QZ13]MDR4886794.1 NERD domain-containing protein [Fredinandcohnia sp. QZ13]